MENKNYQPNYLNEDDARAKSFEIIKSLGGLPIGHALSILDSTKELLLDCHTVNFDSDQFMLRFSEHVENYLI
jgi:hypothetical protein